MTNVVTAEGYNIPKIIYDGNLIATSVRIGDGEDFKKLMEQVSRSGVFFIRKTNPSEPESTFLATVDTPTSIRGIRLYPTDNGMTVSFIQITNPTSRPDDMLFTGAQRSFTATT